MLGAMGVIWYGIQLAFGLAIGFGLIIWALGVARDCFEAGRDAYRKQRDNSSSLTDSPSPIRASKIPAVDPSDHRSLLAQLAAIDSQVKL